MQESVLLFKFLPFIVYIVATIGALLSGMLVYMGLSNKTERTQTRLRVKEKISENKTKLVDKADKSPAEELLSKAEHPLGITGVKYYVVFISLMSLLVINYIIFPYLLGDRETIWTLLLLIAVYFLLLPSFPYSLFRYVVNKVIDYKQAKKNSEIFMLYDLIINEVEMMESSRINTYNLLRNLKPYFEFINGSLTKLLSRWTDDEGPNEALEGFAEDIGSKEAKSLISVLKTLDENDKDTALSSLRGMNNMFVRSQIENYRRRRKVITDLGSLPIRITHFLILLNFVAVVVYMVMIIMEGARN